MIGDDVRVVIVAVDRDTVKLGIEAPRTIPVHRVEVYEEIQRTKSPISGEDAGLRRRTPKAAKVRALYGRLKNHREGSGSTPLTHV